MKAGNHLNSWGFGSFVLNYRRPIAVLLVAITVFMAYSAAHVSIATRFEDLFPANHPNTILYRKYRRYYGGAQTLVLMLRVKRGDIFNFKTLQAIQDMTREVDKLPGVNHNEVFSLASYRVLYARAVPGALISTPFMYPNIPRNQKELDDLKNNVQSHREQLAGSVTNDLKGAMVIASFNEQGMNYKALFDDVQAMIHRHENANTRIYASGAVMFAAWGYHYLARIQLIFLLSIALMFAILFLSLGRRTGWWAPIVTGIASAVWGLGFVSLMGFNFDPIMLVIPFILTARDLSHGIQWQGRYYDQLDAADGKIQACVATADAMLAPGILAVLANVAGIIFIVLAGIPVLRQIGYGGAAWLAASIVMVFVLQPILMSYLPPPRVRNWSLLRGPVRKDLPPSRLARAPVLPGPRIALVAAGALMLVAGAVAFANVKIGYQVAGTPIYATDAKVNRDTAVISRFVPTNIAWVVVRTPNYPSPQSNLAVRTIRMTDDLAQYLIRRGDAVAVLSFATLATKPMNMLLHNGSPKYFAIPDNDALSAALWGFFFGAAAPDEPQAYFAHSPNMKNACIRLLLPDHTYDRLKRLRRDLDQFTRERLAPDPQLKRVTLDYIGGDAGLYLATDDVISRLNVVNVALVIAAILIFCAATFRSPTAGLAFAAIGAAANLVAFIFMDLRNIGLTSDTLPLVSLGIGLGIDYAIYTVARIKDETAGGAALEDAIPTALRTTGVWVFATFAVMVGGIVPWVFSPVLFHTEMSLMLIILMTANLLAGLFIMPALLALIRPRFLSRLEPPTRERADAGDDERIKATVVPRG
jgi:predicted RND superfamily exporter protein